MNSMGIFNFLKSKNPEDRFAVALDIGTEFVKALIFKIDDDKAIIVGSGRQRQKLTDMSGGTVTDIAGVIKNCEAALTRAAEEAKILPSQVIIGIAGEWVKGTTTRIRYTREDPKTHVTISELKNIIARVERRSFDRARSILAWETGHQEIDVRLVHGAIVDVKIDGYKVTNPIGFQGKSIEIAVFNAFAPIVHLGALQTIADQLNLDLISVAAEPYAVAKCLDDRETADYSAIFIDIGGGTTDIALVSSGGLLGTKMFALGGRAFTKRIAQALNISFATAEDLKIKYSEGEVDDEKGALIKKAVEADCEVWLSGVELTLGEYTNVELLPNRILLCGGGSALPEIKKILEKHEWMKKLPFSRKPTIDFIMPSELPTIIDETKKLNQPFDVTPMALANLAINLVGEEEIMDSLMTKVVGGMKN